MTILDTIESNLDACSDLHSDAAPFDDAPAPLSLRPTAVVDMARAHSPGLQPPKPSVIFRACPRRGVSPPTPAFLVKNGGDERGNPRMSACPKCGHPIVGQPNFCPACGASLTFGREGEGDPLIGRTIGGSYKIERLIGEGAMGRVYQAHHIQLRKNVALKILRSNLVNDQTVVKRFEREAHAASRLNHPNCISIYGFGQEDDGELLWMAMEFISGSDLGTIIAEDSPLQPDRVVHIIGQVCEALDEAHSARIIHRDLKPANVVCFDHRRTKDFVKVLDFGIAKIIDPGDDYQALTRDGIVCGTPAYMSPEQVQGLELDNRSDLFSLGIILYQTLTNKLPFYAESAVEVATKIVIEEPKRPSEIRPEWSYPAELEDIAMRLLSKKKEQRYRNAIDVKDALDESLEALKARHDASLDLAPDEMASLIADDAAPPLEGSQTLQISTNDIQQFAASANAKKKSAAAANPGSSVAQISAGAQAAIMTAPATAAMSPTLQSAPTNGEHRKNTGMLVGLGLVIALALGVGAWVMLGN